MRQLKITKSITNRESASLDKYLQEIGREELISVEEEVELAIRYGVHSFPTFLVFRNGKEVERFSGLRNKYDLMNTITKYL